MKRGPQVYKETQLIWCARLHHVPVQIEVATIAGIMGMITTLDEKESSAIFSALLPGALPLSLFGDLSSALVSGY